MIAEGDRCCKVKGRGATRRIGLETDSSTNSDSRVASLTDWEPQRVFESRRAGKQGIFDLTCIRIKVVGHERRERRLELREQVLRTSPRFVGVYHLHSSDNPSCPLCSHRQPMAAGVQREGGISSAVPPAPASATQHGGQVGVHEAASESAGLLN